jgi:hypothetical protein
MSEQRCKFADPKHGGHHCGSYAFNLASRGVKQGEFCDTHYWQARAEKAEAALATQPQAPQGGMTQDDYDPTLWNPGVWRVGLFWSSSNPSRKVRCLAEGEAEIIEYEARSDFIQWLAAPTETPEGAKP